MFYGHPCVCADSALEAARIAQRKKISTTILPAISAFDCLVADLAFDPIAEGCQNYEAMDFLLRDIQYDTRSHLTLWQINYIGIVSFDTTQSRQGIQILKRELLKNYPEDHEVVIYEAANLPHLRSSQVTIPLKLLDTIGTSNLSTLYVPPIHIPSDYNCEIERELGLIT